MSKKNSALNLTISIIFLSFMLASCKNAVSDKKQNASIKIIAQNRPGGELMEFDMEVVSGLDKLMVAEADAVQLDEDDLVLGFLSDEMPLAVPIRYLTGFEVANLSLNENKYLLTWCPLVGTAKLFDGNELEFDFAWGLMHNNLLFVDRKTNSVWGQLTSEAISGPLKGDKIKELPAIQTTWAFWKAKFPTTKVTINKDTVGAPFPVEVFEKEYYANFIPGYERDKETEYTHDISKLGIGLFVGDKQIYFPFNELSKASSPIISTIGEKKFQIHFDLDNYTAWAENEAGDLMNHTIVYQRTWLDFYPNSKMYVFE